MPELPDIEAYRTALESRVLAQKLIGLRWGNPFVLRTVAPKPEQLVGRSVQSVRRIGKRVALGLDGDLFVVLHLMIAGRLQWQASGARMPGKLGLAALDFVDGTLLLTEAGTQRRASVHLVAGEAALAEHDPGGIEPLTADLPTFAARLRAGNHTLKRALTDPHAFAGIGNAYSDEILHAARLSPLQTTQRLTDADVAALHRAVVDVLALWRDRLCTEAAVTWPQKVTAFRAEMAVHGKFGQPCPVCQSPVQRIVYATNACNYCARCQTGGKLLADRALSRLLKDLWPKTVDG